MDPLRSCAFANLSIAVDSEAALRFRDDVNEKPGV